MLKIQVTNKTNGKSTLTKDKSEIQTVWFRHEEKKTT